MTRVRGDSGGHIANCSWPSGLGHLLSQEENGFVLTGVALVWEGRQMPSSCSAQVPAKRPTTSSEVFYNWLGLPLAFVSLAVFPFIKMKGVLDLCRHRA